MLQVFESILESFSFSVTLKSDFCNNALLQVFSLVESCCIEIRALLAAALQKLLSQVSFLGISLSILINFSKRSILDIWPTYEFFSALLHNSRLNDYVYAFTFIKNCNAPLIQRSDSFVDKLVHS